MERKPLNEASTTEANSPPRWRLSWDSRGLVLEERESDLVYAERASSAISFPPTPLAISHPELGKMVESTIDQFVRGWLHDTKRIALAFSPPWGNAWKIPIGTLSGEDLREYIEWELQQRLKDPLNNNIFAWSRVNGDAYAVVINPELLTFWQSIFTKHGIDLSSVTLSSGLVDSRVEQQADLLPLLHLWEESDKSPDLGEDFEVEFHSPDILDEVAPEEGVEDSDSDDTELFNRLHDIRRRFKFPLIWILPAVFVLLLAGAGWLLRDSISGIFSSAPPDDIELADGEDAVPPVVAESDLELQTTSSADPAVIQGITGTTLESLFTSASTHGVQLTSIVLQGSELLVEASGNAGNLDGWRNSLSTSIPGTLDILPSRGASYGLVSFNLPESDETNLSVMQFDQWAVDLGMTSEGQQVYTATRAMVDALILRIDETGARPWRLSIHLNGNNSYYVMMLP